MLVCFLFLHNIKYILISIEKLINKGDEKMVNNEEQKKTEAEQKNEEPQKEEPKIEFGEENSTSIINTSFEDIPQPTLESFDFWPQLDEI